MERYGPAVVTPDDHQPGLASLCLPLSANEKLFSRLEKYRAVITHFTTERSEVKLPVSAC